MHQPPNTTLICLEEAHLQELVRRIIARLKEQGEIGEKVWLTGAETMNLLCISKSSLQKLRDTGELKFSKFLSRNILYDRRSITEFLERKSSGSKKSNS